MNLANITDILIITLQNHGKNINLNYCHEGTFVQVIEKLKIFFEINKDCKIKNDLIREINMSHNCN